MSSISNATLTRAGKSCRWRAPLALVLLAMLYSAIALPWTWRAFTARGAEEQENALGNAEAVAEVVESEADGDGHDLAYYGKLCDSLFKDEDALAYFRFWDADLRLTCEVTRDLRAPCGGNGGRLPDLSLQAAMGPVQAQLKDEAWMETLVDLRVLADNQREITGQLGSAAQQSKTGLKAISGAYVLQEDALHHVETLVKTHPALASVVTDMNTALDTMSGVNQQTVADARDASVQVEDDLSSALLRHRARVDATPALPPTLAKAEPGAHWPFLRGKRILIPLFIPASSDDTSALIPAGYLEVGFYDRPVRDMLLLAATPAAVLVLLALALLLIGRPKRVRMAVEESPSDFNAW